MASIKLENVQKAFGNIIAVDQLNLEIKDGEFFTFLGPSGCGKTTTLRLIAGFYYPTNGIVRFNDKDMTVVPPEKRNTGMVFQNYALFPHMTVFDNVAFGLKVRKISAEEVKKRVNEVLRKVRLESYADRQVSQLSGGQQQRVALARALVIEPEILLLDEPLSNLDAKLRDEMRRELLRLQNEYNITTIYVTHDQAEALSMSDRIAVFHNGVCHQVGTPAEIYHHPVNDFVASFIGDINLFPVAEARVDHEMVYTTVQFGSAVQELTVHQPILKKNGKLALSIRPEAIQILEHKIDSPNVLSGCIDRIEFLGSVIHLSVRVADVTVQVNLLNSRSLNLESGANVLVYFPEGQLRVIPVLSGDRDD